MLRFIDGFDHYVTADTAKKWTAISGTFAISPGNGRNGSGSFRVTSNNSAYVSKTLDDQATWIVGFGFRVSQLPPTGFYALGSFFDTGGRQCDLRLNSDGTLTLNKGGGQLIKSSAPLTLQAGVFYYIEWKMSFKTSVSAGDCKVRVQGIDWIAVPAGTNTDFRGSGVANQVVLGDRGSGSSSNGITADWDDFYCCDTSGSANNDFLGDKRVEALYPNAAGTYSQFTPTGAASNWDCVNDTAQDGDATYVVGSAVGTKDTYGFTDLSTTPTSVSGIQVFIVARKDDAGNRTIAPYLKSGVNEVAGSDIGLPDTYAGFTQVFETEPGDGAWTGASVNALEAGIKITG